MRFHSLLMILMTGLLIHSPRVAAEQTPAKTTPVPIQASAQARYPHFSRHDDTVLMSWVEKQEKSGALFFAKWDARTKSFGKPVKGPHREGMFINWADYPKLQPGKRFWVWVWPEIISQDHKYAYGLRFARSFDQGQTWSQPQWLHDDTSPTEHGFVATAPLSDGRIAAIWLDGRAMAAQQKHGDGHHGGHGDMQLRFRIIGPKTLGPEQLWDDRTCECCGTDLVALPNGALLAAYRNRSRDEVRDIHFIRYQNGKAEKHTAAFNENWNISGCPVNGPALATQHNQIAVAWFSGKDKGSVGVARSQDGGRSWRKSFGIDNNQTGRTDIQYQGETPWISWVQDTETGPQVWVQALKNNTARKTNNDLPHWTTPFPNGRGSGFPQILVLAKETLLLAYTDPDKGLVVQRLHR